MPIDTQKLVDRVIKEMEENTTVISTNSGDTSTATSDQKKQVSVAAAKGDSVKIVKKGTTIQEDKQMDESVSAKVCAAIDEALAALTPLTESEDKKAKKTSANVVGYLNKAKSALEALTAHETKLSEAEAEQNRKAEEKHIDNVKKLIKKKRSKDPNLVDKLTRDYDKVIRKLKDKDPDQVEEAIFQHFLKESANQTHIGKKKALKETDDVTNLRNVNKTPIDFKILKNGDKVLLGNPSTPDTKTAGKVIFVSTDTIKVKDDYGHDNEFDKNGKNKDKDQENFDIISLDK